MIPPINTNLKPARFKHGHNPHGEATRFRKGDTETARRGGKAAWAKRGGAYNTWRIKGGYYRTGIPVEDAHMHPTATLHPGGGASIMRSHLVWNRAHPDDPVQKGEHVHHLNHVRDDDRVENLQKMNAAAHARLHNELRETRERDSLGRFI